jgi:flagellar assembly protein FliH
LGYFPDRVDRTNNIFCWEALLARKIFKSYEIKEVESKVLIAPPHIRSEKEEVEEVIEDVEEIGEAQPLEDAVEVETHDDIEIESEKLFEQAKSEREEALLQAKSIKEEAEKEAFKILQSKSVEARKLKEEAQEEAETILKDAKNEAARLENESKAKADAIVQGARDKAVEEGRGEGFKKGEEEVKRLIERTHAIINAAIDNKKDIIENTEEQLVGLVLLISKKVIKVISETEKKVVIENVKEALKKLGKETEIAIKVNTKDLDLTTKNKRNFISMVESLERVRVEEDDRITRGGCIIETSLGDIDARIQTQLQVIEEKIRELVPIKG